MNESEKGLHVARELASWLRERFGERIVDIRVFGSVARGEADEESDVDVLVLVREPLDREERHELADHSYDLDLAHGTVTQYMVKTTERWDSPIIRGSAFRKDIDREGVPI